MLASSLKITNPVRMSSFLISISWPLYGVKMAIDGLGI